MDAAAIPLSLAHLPQASAADREMCMGVRLWFLTLPYGFKRKIRSYLTGIFVALLFQ